MKIYLRLLQYVRPLGRTVLQYLATTIPYTFFSVFRLALLMPVLSLLFDQEETIERVTKLPEFALEFSYFKNVFYYYLLHFIDNDGKFAALMYVCVIIFASTLLSALFKYLSDVILAKVYANMNYSLQRSFFDKITSLHIGYFSNERKGDLIARMTTDMGEVLSSMKNSMTLILREPIMIVTYFIAMVNISPGLTLMALMVLPLSGGVISGIANRLKKRARKSQTLAGKLTTTLEEVLGGLRVVNAFNAKDFVMNRFDNEGKALRKVTVSIAKRRDLASPLSEFLGVLVILGIVLYGGDQILNSQNSELTGSQFITFIAIFSQVLPPAKNISKAIASIQKGIAGAERMFEVLDVENKVVSKNGAKELASFEQGIEFENVSFSYEEEMVLKNINLKVPKGKTVALVGPSGGGKSTLADLVPRFYDPVEGAVKIDGRALTEYKLESLRDHMGIVTQESILFNDTVFNNIAFGIKSATLEQVRRAAEIANANEFIQELENGFDTVIGERGSKLSGGQRQRLSIARAVLKNPEILILDEATSALDSYSEKLVQEALTTLMKGRTTLVIAHRLSTIQHADHIVVVKDGQICEEGTHEGLILQGGVYKKLIEMQCL